MAFFFFFCLCLLLPLVSCSLSASLQPSIHQRTAPLCGSFCRFRLCNTNNLPSSFTLPKAAFILLTAPKTTTLPYICLSRTSIGQITLTTEAQIALTSRILTPISSYSPPGISTRFSKKFITTKKIPFFKWSGVTRAGVKGNQWAYLHDQCFVLPILQYEIIDSDTGRFINSVDLDGGKRDCVAFRTTAPTIHVQVLWDSSDDFDLTVVEPDGDVLDFRNARSEAGKLNGDNHKGFCNADLPAGREDVVYFPGGPIENGTYEVRVTRSSTCGTRPTRWTLLIMKSGVVIKRRRGTSREGGKTRVLTTKFRYP